MISSRAGGFYRGQFAWKLHDLRLRFTAQIWPSAAREKNYEEARRKRLPFPVVNSCSLIA